MSYLTGKEAKELHAALRSAFSPGSLKQMVRFELGESLEDISLARNFSEITLDLIEWAEQQGLTQKLIEMKKF